VPQNKLKKLVVATNNPGKILEIREILKSLPCDVLPVSVFDPEFYVKEDGTTYAENAVKKAKQAASYTNHIAIADDSGLEVDALDGAPGIYSARFGGAHLSQAEKNALLLHKLTGVTKRTARFRCVIAVVSPEGRIETAEGICEGLIGTEERGTGGFGFDPVFIVPKYRQTMAELEPRVKNTISHRARALRKLPPIVVPLLGNS
jgi:XTP/dITP diphosphohydrolase